MDLKTWKTLSFDVLENPMERFNEDALRMMRVRFAGQLGFTIESKTFNAIRALKSNLERVAVERMKNLRK